MKEKWKILLNNFIFALLNQKNLNVASNQALFGSLFLQTALIFDNASIPGILSIYRMQVGKYCLKPSVHNPIVLLIFS